MTMSIWVFLLIVGAALLTGHSVRAKAAAGVFFLVGVVIGASYAGEVLREMVSRLADLFA